MNIPVFYTPKMVSDSGSFSPSAAKPAKVVESWLRQFPIDVIEPEPVDVQDYALAHDISFVADILACRKENGFGNKSPAVAAALPYTAGAMLDAASNAIASGRVAAAPCSGFHHAEYKKAMGFCTFNGLMVAALALRHAGVAKTVGILDFDMHYGNGTDDIIRKLGCAWIRHYTAGAFYQHPTQAPSFFKELPRILEGFSFSHCDVVLYQAGADPHINDPHGGWLTTSELQKRDALVFEAFAAAKVPVAWNLAGGYQIEPDGSIPKVLEIHDNTMRECVRVYGSLS